MTSAEQGWLHKEFQRCKHWIEAALARTIGEYGIEHVEADVQSGKAQLWPAPNGCVVTHIETCPTGLKVLRAWLAGGDLAELQATEEALCNWGRSSGCDFILIAGREGWLRRLAGYRKLYTVMAKDLRK